MGFLLNPYDFGPGGAYSLSAGPGALVLTGGAATLTPSQLTLSASPGALALTGGAATLAYSGNFSLSAEPGALALAGGAATLTYSGAADPHRHWRVYVSANNGNLLCGMAELELYETVSGSNVATGGTASANSYLTTGFEASYAFDGIQSGSNGWASYVAGAPWWIKYDFGSGNDKDINEIGMWAKNVGLDEMPKDFDIQWSDDDSTWTTKWSETNATSWSEYEQRRFSGP